MKSVYLMLVKCLCYVQFKKYMLTAVFGFFFCPDKIACLKPGQFFSCFYAHTVQYTPPPPHYSIFTHL